MIRFGEKKDIKSIEELWNIIFDEEPGFNQYFFENIFDYSNTLIMEKGNELLSMAQMMPYEIEGLGKVTYIYGAATNPRYRNRGLMSELLKRSFDIDCEMGKKASILIPANKPLFDFYSRLGYRTEFYVNEYTYVQGEKIDKVKEAGNSDIEKLMNIYKGDIVRNRKYWEIQLDMYSKLGGKVFIYKNGYAVVSDTVEEIMCEDTLDREVLLNYICRYLKREEVKVKEKGGNTPFGMIKRYDESPCKKLYMNLMYN